MAESDPQPEQTLPGPVQTALMRMRGHPQVEDASIQETSSAWTAIICRIRVNLPTRYHADGQTPTGVQVIEPVRLQFSAHFPLYPPHVTLRADFNRNLPHIQPGSPDALPQPCYLFGDPRELLAQRGINGIIDQLVDWLHRAAQGTLIDHKDGWEPVRRDTQQDVMVVDCADLRARAAKRGGHRFLATRFMRRIADEHDGAGKGFSVHARVSDTHSPPRPQVLRSLGEEPPNGRLDLRTGRTLTLLVSPDNRKDGQPVICDEYKPETVHDIATLLERADEYGCLDPLKQAMGGLNVQLAKFQKAHDATFDGLPLFVILVARRPCAIMGTDSPLELVPYVLELGSDYKTNTARDRPVYPMAMHNAISRELLAEMSGVALPSSPSPWVQIGAGSLGSKIATHMARAGLAPQTVVDNKCLSAHNSARHALTYPHDPLGLAWMTPKADAIAGVIAGLGQTAKPIHADAVGWCHDEKALRRAVPQNTSIVVNTTASLAVRNALASISTEHMSARVAEAALYSQGAVGILTLEGSERNPNTHDLALEVYAQARENSQLVETLFNDDVSVGRQSIGEGCDTATMVMSDAHISQYAAAMSTKLMEWRTNTSALPETGQVYIGQISAKGMNLDWTCTSVEPFEIIIPDNAADWQIRIAPRALDKIRQECARYPHRETGGILVGVRTNSNGTVTVMDTLPASDDSERQPSRFTLGIRGLEKMLQTYTQSTGGTLYCVGTWGSHLANTPPSRLDYQTVQILVDRMCAPAVDLSAGWMVGCC